MGSANRSREAPDDITDSMPAPRADRRPRE